jgi:SAM-dependent methyltransferase
MGTVLLRQRNGVMAVRSILAASWGYRLFGLLIGAQGARATFAREYVRPRPGLRVLDMGCGPGSLVPHLVGTEYVGFDVNSDYVDAARARFGDRVQVFCGAIEEQESSRFLGFDVAVASGVLHHLDDAQALHMFRLARSSLKPGGRLVTLDGTYTERQSRAAAFLLRQDRGRHVRTTEEYVRLASAEFAEVHAVVRTDLLRIPYTHVILECSI